MPKSHRPTGQSEPGETEDAAGPHLDADLRKLLAAAGTIAVVGMKGDESEDAYRVPHYMQQHGYRIIPVNPKLETILGERAHASLSDVDLPVDLVNLFRAPDHVSAHVDEILMLPSTPRGSPPGPRIRSVKKDASPA